MVIRPHAVRIETSAIVTDLQLHAIAVSHQGHASLSRIRVPVQVRQALLGAPVQGQRGWALHLSVFSDVTVEPSGKAGRLLAD
jgi:hypothetical protein